MNLRSHSQVSGMSASIISISSSLRVMLPTYETLAVQQEQPLAPPVLSAASTDANRTMTGSKHKGTVYPDKYLRPSLPCCRF